MKLNDTEISNIERLIAERFIDKTKHPEVDLWILNYTQNAQFSGLWTHETMLCRGLVVDKDWNVKARPFKKFFNLEQHETIPGIAPLPWAKGYTIEEKMDGSLGILYWMGEYGKSEPRIATRGSFTSDQAIKATEMLRKIPVPYTTMFQEGYTYLFEILYPENRIVVDYHGKEELVLLSAMNIETGKEAEPAYEGFRRPIFYPADTPKEVLIDLVPNDGSIEGLVVRFTDGQRVKVKTEEYVRLHRLLTGVSNKSIWELLKAGSLLDEIIERVPDEFYDWVKQVKDGLEKKHYELMLEANNLAIQTHAMERKDAAEIILKRGNPISGATFAILDGKQAQAEQAIWKAIKPTFERPFKKDIDL